MITKGRMQNPKLYERFIVRVNKGGGSLNTMITTYVTHRQKPKLEAFLEKLRKKANSKRVVTRHFTPTENRFLQANKIAQVAYEVMGEDTYWRNKQTKLTERELFVLALKDDIGFTYEHIGMIIGVTRQRIEQIYKRAISK